jgi:ribonuclease III
MTPAELQLKLGHQFKQSQLLAEALTHRSFGQPNNERLEFLGDSILNCVIANLLFEQYGTLDEGDLSRLRSNLVKQQTLYEIAQKLNLGAAMKMGDGEQKSGGQRRPSMLADCVEALFGAVFIDAGFDVAQALIRRQYGPVISGMNPNTLGKDAKTLLQEHLQGRKIPLPVYAVVATYGAAHNQMFEVECSIAKLEIKVLGSGGSRRAAEQSAAKTALAQALALPATSRKAKATPVASESVSLQPMSQPPVQPSVLNKPAEAA